MTLRLSLFAAALAASALAWGEAPATPERVAQLTYAEGDVTFHSAQGISNSNLPDRPLARGDRLITKQDARAEIALDTAAVRLDERSELAVVALEPTNVRLGLDAGTANVTLRDLIENETFAIATPNTVITLDRPGDYRVDVESDHTSFLSVHGGGAQIATAGGPVRVADGQRVRIAGRDAVANLETPRPTDKFDDWVLEREVQLADAQPPPDDSAYEDLEHYGEWRDDPGYGQVWMPSYAYGGYDPLSYGYWQQNGYSSIWIGTMPWYGYTHQSGHWMYLRDMNRWCWVPTRPGHRPPQVAGGYTAPYGHPRGSGSQHGGDVEHEPAPLGSPHPIDPDHAPVHLGGGAPGKPTHGGTLVPRPSPTPITPRLPVAPSPTPAPSVAPSPAPSQAPSHSAPMGSSRTSTTKPSNSSSTMSSPTRESGARPLP